MLTLMQAFGVRVHAFSALLVALTLDSPGRRLSRVTEPLYRFVTIQLEVASRFSDFGASTVDDCERDVVADCSVGGAVHRVGAAGILSEVDVSHPMVAVFDRPMTAVPCKQFFRCAPVLWN